MAEQNNTDRKVSPAGAAVNRIINEAGQRKLSSFEVVATDNGAGAAMRDGDETIIDQLGVDFDTLRQRLVDLCANAKRRLLSRSPKVTEGAFRLKLGAQELCVLVKPHAMEPSVACVVYVPRDYRPAEAPVDG